MGKKNQYPVQKFYGLPLATTPAGEYILKLDQEGQAKIHTWRTGKHTRGKYTQPGQLMLTENNLMVMIVAAEPMAFKDRHQETPLARFLTSQAPAALLKQGQALLGAKQ